MRKTTCLLLAIFLLQGSIFAYPARQVLQISYCDDDRIQAQIPRTPNFMRSRRDTGVDRGYMALYQHLILDSMGTISIHVGGNVARWESQQDQLTTGSLFLSGRLWVLHLLFLHPYVEYSLFGPTLVSKSAFAGLEFGSRFLFQNFFGVGVELGSERALSVDLKMLRYYESDNFQPKKGFRVPLVASVGISF